MYSQYEPDLVGVSSITQLLREFNYPILSTDLDRLVVEIAELRHCIEVAQAEVSYANYRLVAGNIAGEPIPAAEVGEVFQRLTLLLQGHDPDEQREAETAFACERCGGFNVQVIKITQSGKGIGICDDCGENQVVPADMVGVCPHCGQDVALTGHHWNCQSLPKGEQECEAVTVS